jgi:Ca2+-binding RTX toxin-like protein
MAKPVGTTAQLADYLLNGFWFYAGERPHHWATSTITYNINGLNAAEKFLAQSALNAWHEVANLAFVQTSSSANITFNHNGSMTAYETDSYSSGITRSATIDISADWITNDGGARDGKTGIDSYGYQTYLHEIGHALGLGHQGPYNGSASYSSGALYANDTWQYSLMSYFSEPNYDGGSYRYVITPQMADIYAVQSLYGAATTRASDTTYGFHNTAGSIFNFSSYTQAPALTIYDSGGNDTLDCSGYSATQTIDLHSGAFSSVGGLVHNIGIATNTTIETAIGGSGKDKLIANDSGCSLYGGAGADTLVGGLGSDQLIGGAGIDTLTGGGGEDIFTFATGDSSAVSGAHDLITDFTSGTDKFDLTGIFAAFHFLATSAFDGAAGALDYFFDAAHAVTVLQGDVNGDRTADFAIDLTGNKTLILDDFDASSGSTPPAPPPELTVSNLALDATNLTLSFVLHNDGSVAGASTTGFYLSLDTTITTADMLIGTQAAPALAASASDAETVALTLPANLSPHVYYLGVIADYDGSSGGDGHASAGTIGLLLGNNSGNTLTGTSTAHVVFGLGGNDTLYDGPGGDALCGGAGNDTYYVGNAADTVVENAGQGTDTVRASVSYALSDDVENLVLRGNTGNAATGNDLNNQITGNGGSNVISGGLGNDKLIGGDGADTFVFNTALNDVTNVDTITDFRHGQADKIALDHTIFTALGSPQPDASLQTAEFYASATGTAHAATDFILYNVKTGALFYDADGDGAAAATHFATLSNHPTITAHDFLIV